MFIRRNHLLTPDRLRRLIAGVVCVCVLAANIPIPVMVSTTAFKDRSIPFPCQDDACGCRSAQQCWSSCCCYSDRERLAWAEAHHVVVPATFAKPVTPPPAKPACSHCATQCQSKANANAKPETETKTETNFPTRYLLTSAVLKCGGETTPWGGLPWGIVVVKPPSIDSIEDHSFARPTSDRLPSSPAVPPTPPPRVTPV